MKLNNIITQEYIINSSDIVSFSKDNRFNNLLKCVDNSMIVVNSKLIHNGNISHLEQFIFNLDNYISFIKKNLKLDQLEIRYLIELTIYNKNNSILLNKTYFYDNKEYYLKEFKKLFMFNYIRNYNILKKYIKINKYDFETLINKLNHNKNKAHFYFEDINKNLPYYINIIDYLENTSNILV